MEISTYQLDYYGLGLIFNKLDQEFPDGYQVESIDQDSKTDYLYVKLSSQVHGASRLFTYVFNITEQRSLEILHASLAKAGPTAQEQDA